MIFPAGAGELVAWFKDSDDAAFDAVAPVVEAGGGIERGGGRADILRLREQSGLVFLELDDQSDVCGAGDFEDVFLTVQRIERDQGAGGDAEFGQQLLGGRDLV